MKPEVSDDAEGHGESSQGWPPRLFDEIVDVLAEALVVDYQQVSGPTVSSPPGSGHTILLTESPRKDNGSTVPSTTT